jgi:hypothetical protein
VWPISAEAKPVKGMHTQEMSPSRNVIPTGVHRQANRRAEWWDPGVRKLGNSRTVTTCLSPRFPQKKCQNKQKGRVAIGSPPFQFCQRSYWVTAAVSAVVAPFAGTLRVSSGLRELPRWGSPVVPVLPRTV